MFFLPFLYYLISNSAALPIPASDMSSWPDNIPTCSDNTSTRTLLNIIQSCLTTILACTWVAIHPNIPEPGNTMPLTFLPECLRATRVFLSRRLPLFMVSLLVPEYLLAWAIRQRLVANRIVEEAKELEKNPGKKERWTMAHGFFIIMGGFHRFKYSDKPDGPDEPDYPLGWEEVSHLIVDPKYQFDLPTQQEIQDKSKSDWLAKTIVLGQTAWFVMQCIARPFAGLPITELEIVTIAYATMAFGIYVVWWDKPYNVDCPVRVYRVPEETKDDEGKGKAEEETTDDEGKSKEELPASTGETTDNERKGKEELPACVEDATDETRGKEVSPVSAGETIGKRESPASAEEATHKEHSPASAEETTVKQESPVSAGNSTDNEGKGNEALPVSATNVEAKGKEESPVSAEETRGKRESPVSAEEATHKEDSPASVEETTVEQEPPVSATDDEAEGKEESPVSAEETRDKRESPTSAEEATHKEESPASAEETTVKQESPVNGGNSTDNEGKGNEDSPASKNVSISEQMTKVVIFLYGQQDDAVNLKNHTSVPTFYAGKPVYEEIDRSDVITLSIGVVFGAIHCVAWPFQFASDAERTLWHISSAAMVGVPAMVGISALIMSPMMSWEVKRWYHHLAFVPMTIIYLLSLGPGGLLYIFTRIVTLLLAFLALRSLPPGAYQEVYWTTLFPHI